MANWFSNTKAAFDRAFPERQIYHRTGGTVRFISVTPWQQAIAATAVAAFVLWSGFLTIMFVVSDLNGSAQTTEARRDASKAEQYVAKLRAQSTMQQTMIQKNSAEREQESAEIEDRLEAIESVVDELKNDEGFEISALKGDGAAILVRASIDEADSRQARELPLVTADAAQFSRSSVRATVNPWEDEQERVLRKAEEVAIERTERARGVLAMTSVGTGRIMENAAEGQGGPELSLDALIPERATALLSQSFLRRLNQTSARIVEMKHYEDIIASMPLSQPVGVEYRLTSRYGLRIDPFRKRPQSHAGLDMAAFRNAPIIAAGPGTVTVAGVKSGYGRVIEIDHGNGFKTRYGHLNTIGVTVGQEVKTGDKIGGMGSTGRSTGDHLHYEVWFNNKPNDPAHFLKAGRHVHKR